MTTVTRVLTDLIQFKTISKTDNLAMVDYLQKHHESLGFDCVRIMSPDEPRRANLLCRIGPDDKDGLLLSGHMDVVPVAGQHWQSDPFILTKRENKLIGRGAADMKGFIATTCMALENIPFHKLKKPLSLLWTYDEEVGCTGSFIAAPLLKNYFKHMPTAALIGEPTDFAIMRMHAGHVTVKIHCQGKGAHSSDPERGISAIKAAHDVLHGLFALETELKAEKILAEHFIRPYVVMNVGEIHGGSAVNIVPDEAVLTVGFRPLPTVSVDDIFLRMGEHIHKCQQDSRVVITTTIEKNTPSMMTQVGGRLEKTITPFAKPGPVAAQFATDGGNLSASGIECLIFGPGSINVAHQANEWIDERDLNRAVAYVTAIIEHWQHER